MPSHSLDAFHAHEVLHVASIIADLFEHRIEQHAFTQSDPTLSAAAQRLTGELYDFYQMVGRKTVATGAPSAPRADLSDDTP